MAFDANPLAAFTLIAAPAVLTNAAAVLALSTSNRFSRTLDRARNLAQQLNGNALSINQRTLRRNQFDRAQVRTFFLLKALSSFYLALATFAITSVISIIGITATAVIPPEIANAGPWIAAWCGCVGVAMLAVGCIYLVKETRLAVQSITEEADHLRSDFLAQEIPSSSID